MEKYNERIPDSKWKDAFDKIRKKFAKDYYDMVDFFISDIIEGKMTNEKRKIISEMLDEIKPVVDSGTRNIWDKLKDLIGWD